MTACIEVSLLNNYSLYEVYIYMYMFYQNGMTTSGDKTISHDTVCGDVGDSP